MRGKIEEDRDKKVRQYNEETAMNKQSQEKSKRESQQGW